MSTIPCPTENTTEGKALDEHWFDLVACQVASLKFGSVHITVRDGRIPQVETSARVRFAKAS